MHHVTSALLLAALAAAGGAEAANSAAGTLMTMRVDGEVTVDLSGKVSAYEIDTKVDPAIRGVIDKAVGRWKFKPIVVDGAPVKARTSMRITLGAEEKPGGYAVFVDNVNFTDTLARKVDEVKGKKAGKVPMDIPNTGSDVAITVAKKGASPRYPAMGLMNRVNADVLLMLKVGADGKVLEVVPVQSSLLNVRGSDRALEKLREEFERTAAVAFKSWKMDVKVKPGVTPTEDDMTGLLSVRYSIPDSSAAVDTTGTWRIENRSIRRSVPWLPPASVSQRPGVSDFLPGEMRTASEGEQFQLLQGAGS